VRAGRRLGEPCSPNRLPAPLAPNPPDCRSPGLRPAQDPPPTASVPQPKEPPHRTTRSWSLTRVSRVFPPPSGRNGLRCAFPCPLFSGPRGKAVRFFSNARPRRRSPEKRGFKIFLPAASATKARSAVNPSRRGALPPHGPQKDLSFFRFLRFTGNTPKDPPKQRQGPRPRFFSFLPLPKVYRGCRFPVYE